MRNKIFLLCVFLCACQNLYGFTYVKGGMSLIGDRVLAPTLSLGQRYGIASVIGIDFSWSLAASRERKVGMYTSPRLAGLVYLNPWMENRLYVGGAASWAFIVDAEKKHGFTGVMAEAIVGIQFQSICLLNPFMEVSRAYPYTRFSSKIGRIGKHPTTTVMFGLGL